MSSPDAALPRRFEPDARPARIAGMRAQGVLSQMIAATRAGRPVAVAVALGAAMLMAVTLLIGRPTVFTDTDDYFSQGKDVVRALQVWATQGKPPIKLAEVDDRLHDPGDRDEEPVHNQNGARSVYYGLFVYACERLGTLWLLAAAQALLAAGLVYALWRRMAPGAAVKSYLLTMAALAAGSSLPVFTGFAMPDLFAGFSVMTTLLATLYAGRSGRWGRGALWLLLAACMNFHGSNLLISLGLSTLILAWTAMRGAPWRSLAMRAGFVLSAAVVAVLASQAYALAIKLRTGDDLGRPPFLTARVLADGPGRAYLRHACAQGVKLTLCAYRRAPLDNTEDILWSDDPATGIFNSADYPTRLKLEQEEKGFVINALAYDPAGEAAAALRNWGRQLVAVDYAEPLRDPAYYLTDEYWKTTTLRPLLLRDKRCDPERGGCILHVPAVLMSEIDAAIAILALAWLGWALGREVLSRRASAAQALDLQSGKVREDAAACAAFMVVAVALNAAVCGMLSGPFDRYEARLLWLVPCAALLLATARRRAR